MDQTILEIAEAIARKAHDGQFRYNGVTPLIVHPEATAAMLTDPKEKAVAWLHDAIEDSEITAEILLEFSIPEEVVDAVVAITQLDDESYPDYHRRVAKNPLAARVKMADMCHNMMDEPTRRSIRKYAYLIAHITLGTPLPDTYEGLE
jgi:(p)ppGpp synthase/HD superfamily hydrolase